MKQFYMLAVSLGVVLSMVGCGDSGSTSMPIEKSELEKYVEENPVPLVGAEDFGDVEESDME
ncbi:hypothetical protein [Rhodopirellula sallentina]|uniref:Secreted protein n=1 Tax=Rhodopirellula sallentina SM41 TaxID=1263870 RepID=M5U7P5_9BACT|nr:hypothetical protein [Rhodopirellula sallentina]EMI57284.1 secreted protein [Rhodopirellula sallentina SM41]